MTAIFVAWQNPDSRVWAPVGRLTKEESNFKFVYTRGAEDMLPGFQPFGRMTDLHATYYSNELFPLFSNRVLSKSRPEYRNYLNWLGLDEAKHNVMDELSRTGGLRATDSIEMFPCPEPTASHNYETFFFSRGLSYLHAENQIRAQSLQTGEPLFLMTDPQNEFDSMALLLRTGDPISLVGYAPKYFSAEFTELLNRVGAEKVKVTVERVNVDAPIQYRVLCRLRAPWPSGFSPCGKGQFQALA
jgi:hypothetical protein